MFPQSAKFGFQAGHDSTFTDLSRVRERDSVCVYKGIRRGGGHISQPSLGHRLCMFEVFPLLFEGQGQKLIVFSMT